MSEKLVQKTPQDEVVLQTKVESILKRYRVKEQLLLTQLGQSLSGLYSGNPKRATSRPTAEQLLAAFCDLTSVSLS